MGLNRVNENEVIDEFKEYAVQRHHNELLKILEYTDLSRHYSITVNFVTLFESSTFLGDGILSQPIVFLPLFDKAFVSAQYDVVESSMELSLKIKPLVHARISALPVCPELYKSVFPRNEELGSFLRVSGTVVRRTSPKMLEFRKTYMCHKCKFQFVVYAEYEKYYSLPPVNGCRNPEKCKSSNLINVECQDDFKDYQELKIQEQVGKLDMGSIPKSMLITLEDDLVDTCKPGDDVVICGTVRRRWKSFMVGLKPEVHLVLQANHIEVSNAQNNTWSVTQELKEEFNQFWKIHRNKPLNGRNFILQCVCPEVYGLYLIKLAIALVLSGGVAQYPGTGARVRGECHLLLVGDPGTAKSQLLKFAAAMSPRSVFTTGVGSTSAGLTVSAAMAPGGEWQLEAGALVLADGGICCIDEFNSIRESERASIHEAMEQQTLSVAKAGMVCKLSTVCSILAATNPKGQFDTAHPITVNCAIASPLLSRFDLVFVLLDRKNKDWDSLISSYIISGKTVYKSDSSELWNVEKLQAYFTVVKAIRPILSEDATLILKTYYQAQRANELRSASRITVRLLESLVRLAQAHAKFMFRTEVSVQDAVIAVSVMEATHQASSIDAYLFSPIQTTFPNDPEMEYMEMAHKVLGNLGLQQLLDDEISNYMKRHSTRPTTDEVSVDDSTAASQLFPSSTSPKSDLKKKMGVVLNNFRQSKLREEQQAIALQCKGAVKRKTIKRKTVNESKKRKTSKRQINSGSSDGESSGDDPKSMIEKEPCETKKCQGRPIVSNSGSDFTEMSQIKETITDNTKQPSTSKTCSFENNPIDRSKFSTLKSKKCVEVESNPNSPSCSSSESIDSYVKTISSKTLNKLKAFAFKEPSNPLNSSSSSGGDSKNASSSLSLGFMKAPSSTQSSIFQIGDEDGSSESDYEL